MPIFSGLRNKWETARAQTIVNFFEYTILPKSKVLDIGSGNGIIANIIREKRNAEVICLDIADNNKTKQEIIVYDGKHIPFENELFDTALLIFVLHHSKNSEDILKEAYRILKPGGRLVVFEDTYSNPFQYIIVAIMDIVLNVWDFTPLPLQFKKEEAWKKIFEGLDFSILSTIHVRLGRFDFVKHPLFILKKKQHTYGS